MPVCWHRTSLPGSTPPWVENRDGSGGLAALAALLVRPEDGLTIMHASCEAAIMSQMLQLLGATLDVAT